jgi:hypothetical protein
VRRIVIDPAWEVRPRNRTPAGSRGFGRGPTADTGDDPAERSQGRLRVLDDYFDQVINFAQTDGRDHRYVCRLLRTVTFHNLPQAGAQKSPER